MFRTLRRWGLCLCLILSFAAVGIYSGRRAVLVIQAQLPVRRAHTLIVDPGHGGEDGGATSCTGRLESVYNLEIALRLEDMLHFLGFRTEMIRRTDTAIYRKGETIAQKKVDDLKNRVRIVNETSGGVLLSIHQNYFSQAQYSGAQVFYSKNNPESEKLAKAIQQDIRSLIQPQNQRAVKRTGTEIYLLYHAQSPAVMVECGFLSNAAETLKLKDDNYQNAMAFSVMCGITDYLKQDEKLTEVT